MKSMRSFIAVLLCGLMSLPAGLAQQVAQNSEVIIVPAGDSFLRWFAHEGRTYFIQGSAPNDHLRSWVWSSFIESGNDQQISHEINATADRAFFCLHYTDEQPPPGVSLEDWDADGDGLPNALELILQTNPLVADTSGDGIPDGWAYVHGFNPLNNNAAGMFQGGTTTNLEAFKSGVQAHPAATLADRDGDLILNEVDADPDERVIDWAPASHPAFAVIELNIDDVDDWVLNDFTAKGTVLLSRNQESAPFDRAVIDRKQVAHLFLNSNTPTVGAPFAGFGPTLFGEQVMGFRLVDGYSVESLWDPLTNTFAAWQRPFGYDDSLCDERDGVYVAKHWLNLSPGSPSGLRQSPDGALLPGGSVIQSSDCRIEENGNIVSHNGYWRKDPDVGTLGNVQSLPATPSALRSATLVQGSPEEVKWNLVAAHSGLMVAKADGAFVQASGALRNVPIHGVTKQGWVVDTQQNRIRANGKWYSMASLLRSENYEEADILDIMDTGLAIAKTRRSGQARRLSLLFPIDLVPDDNVAGVIGDMVKSIVPGSSIKHFITPKSDSPLVGPPEPIDQDYVVLTSIGVTAEQITPGHANQIVEWSGGEAVPNEPLQRRVKRDIAAMTEVAIKEKHGGAAIVQMKVWVTWADLTLEDDTPKMMPQSDTVISLTLRGKVSYRYTCHPNEMFDLAQDIPNLNLPPDPPVPGGNHPWPPHESLANGASIRYDATRQVRVILSSSDQVVLDFEREDGCSDVPDFPDDISIGNDDPSMGGELMPYQSDVGTQGRMTSIDLPVFSLQHVRGLPDSTFSMHAQFRQYARVQIAGKWYRCSDLKLSDLVLKFKKTNGKWSDDGSSFVIGNGPFPLQ